jgi:hypothetical protein
MTKRVIEPFRIDGSGHFLTPANILNLFNINQLTLLFVFNMDTESSDDHYNFHLFLTILFNMGRYSFL